MRSAKTLMKSLRDWKSHENGLDYDATIFVVGWASNPCEPLLLEALVNHPGCKKLYFIPLDGPAGNLNYDAMDHELYTIGDMPSETHLHKIIDFIETRTEPAELLAYDLSDLLNRRGGPSLGAEKLEKRLQEHFQGPVVPVSTSDVDIYMAGHGEHLMDAFVARRNEMAAFINNPVNALLADSKVALPFVSDYVKETIGVKITPVCAQVVSLDDIRQFMDDHGYDQIVLKEPDNSCGHGIYRVFRGEGGTLMGEIPDRSFECDEFGSRLFTLTDDFLADNSMLAMEWLDNTRGDIRAVILNGSVVGAYKRHHGENTWLCNYAQGGSIHAVDLKRGLSAADRRKLNAIAKGLEKFGISSASVDLLANTQGERFLSEINIGNTDDLIEISKHWDSRNAAFGRLCVPDQVAAETLADYRNIVERREIIRQAREATLQPAM